MKYFRLYCLLFLSVFLLQANVFAEPPCEAIFDASLATPEIFSEANIPPVVQSVQIVSPSRQCINNCRFCVARMPEGGRSQYQNIFRSNFEEYKQRSIERLNRVRKTGTDTVVITGDTEPQQNKRFLKSLGEVLNGVSIPFEHVELQAMGVLLDVAYLKLLREVTGVTTINLSVASFVDKQNWEYAQMPEKIRFKLKELCKLIKAQGFTLRISAIMTDYFNTMTPEDIFRYANEELGADQITFHHLYSASNETVAEDVWVNEHRTGDTQKKAIDRYIVENGKPILSLRSGRLVFRINRMSVTVNDDCLGKKCARYVILREDGHFYSEWESMDSLLY